MNGNLLEETESYIKKNKETRSVAVRDDGVQVENCMCMPCNKNIGKDENVKDTLLNCVKLLRSPNTWE
jgi:hypothetical protein